MRPHRTNPGGICQVWDVVLMLIGLLLRVNSVTRTVGYCTWSTKQGHLRSPYFWVLVENWNRDPTFSGLLSLSALAVL